VAAAKAVEAGMEKKEVAKELDRIQRNMRQHFQLEFQNLLQSIETKGDHRRLIRFDFLPTILLNYELINSKFILFIAEGKKQRF